MIKINNVNKYFNRHKRNEIHVINNTSLDLPDKGLVALLGASGSGKTTLLNVIGGLDNIDSGSIYINNEKITRVSSSKVDDIRNSNIGYIFQNYNLIDDMTVFENVALVLRMIGLKDKKIIKDRVNYVLNKLGIYKYRNKLSNMLSGGERQRVGIARAIVKNPNIIIADEPTGNLDSKNTIEIMNIIKTISKDKLVILVTHEKDIAYFYSDRIILIEDGKVISDKKNEHNNDLDYKIENKIYLKDIKNYKRIETDKVNIDYYSENDSKLNIKIVVKNGNIYIDCDENKKIESASDSVELINDKYKKITKDVYNNYVLDYKDILNNNFKIKYKSIFNIFTLIKNGLNKVKRYSLLRKILLIGFIISSMVLTYSVSNIMGVSNIKDEKFIKYNSNYLMINNSKLDINTYLEYEKLDSINYIIPGDSLVNFRIKYDRYFQSSFMNEPFNASLSSINMINEDNLIYGRMPSNKYEVVMDKFVLDKIKYSKNIGIFNIMGFINMKVSINNMKDFTIVGITDLKSPSIYTYEEMFINILSNNAYEYYGEFSYVTDSRYEHYLGNVDLFDYKLYDDIKLLKGNYPENDYEIIVNYKDKEVYELNKEINLKVNNKKLKVVGYYESAHYSYMLSNTNTIKYKLLSSSKDIMIYPKDKDKVINYFMDKNLNIKDSYLIAKQEYIDETKKERDSSILSSFIVLSISLVEMYLIIRSSFLSRIKEIGIYRAIGVKKKDVYKMFLGEILSIFLVTSLPGCVIMSYIVSKMSGLPIYSDKLLYNPLVFIISMCIILLFNILIGLLPVICTMTLTPHKILSSSDID